jgi:hypothetical protein
VYRRQCNQARWTAVSAEEREKNNSRRRQLARKRREAVLAHYGGICQCCGEMHYEFLAIDHVNGNGKAHRKDLGMAGTKFYKWLIDQHFPEGFRVLCHNCNMSYGFYGYCPHQRNL